MRKLKNSGFGYLGEVPSDWKIERIKNHLRFSPDKNPGEARVLSLYRDLGVIPKDTRSDNHNVTSEDTSNYRYVLKGDFVVNKMKAWQGSMAVSEYEGVVSPAYYVYRFTSNEINKRYFHYLLRSKCYADEFRRLSGGIRIGQWDLSKNGFETTYITLPSIEEQIRIAAKIDDQLSKVERLIVNVQQQIEKLCAYRKMVITDVVTRGLNATEEMKSSGVDWIDVIPKNWRIVPLKSLFSFGKGLPITKENLVEQGVPVISYGQIHAKWNTGVTTHDELLRFVDEGYLETNPSSLVKKGDIIMADTSEDRDGCGNCAYIDTDATVFAGYHTIILSSLKGSNNKYLAYLFLTDAWRSQIRKNVSGVKLFSISRRILNATSVIVPDNSEEMIEYLDSKCSKIDSLIAIKQAKIDELEQYKKSLVYEYVTGKKEVS